MCEAAKLKAPPPWVGMRVEIVGEFDAARDWAADGKLVSGEDVEMIPAEEFFKDTDTKGRLFLKNENSRPI
jgi:hypothetical protein